MTGNSLTQTRPQGTATLALGLSLVAVVIWLAASAADVLYAVFPVPALAAVVLSWKASAGARPRGRALAAMTIGGLLVLAFVGFFVAFLITG
ncbi:MAG TPA: hypothetical protein VNA14_11020 [Mycobacteriales bacterium]|nr:hypothetical protein [Mycobacteriales bacterium]